MQQLLQIETAEFDIGQRQFLFTIRCGCATKLVNIGVTAAARFREISPKFLLLRTGMAGFQLNSEENL
jgi:hypothetical protein